MCKVIIKFVKPGLVKVTEDGDCAGIVGGVNVTTNGTYKRISQKKPKFNGF